MTENKASILVDFAIKTKNEDLLSRVSFSEQIGRAISDWKQQESLIIGLYGNWGSGKTSVKHMMKEYFVESDAAVEYVEFNPWQWSHSENLIDKFFSEIIATLLKDKETNKELVKKLIEYSEYLNVASRVIEKSQQESKYFFIGLAAILGAASIKLDGGNSIIGFIITTILYLLANSIMFINWALNIFLDYIQIRPKLENLEDKKEEIIRLLKKHPKTILIVIDDIDRLTPCEIKDLFKLIKGNADFPKLVYLTIFQRNIVEHALNYGSYEGKNYLEKIIQIGFNIPEIPSFSIQKIIFSKLTILFNEHDAWKDFEQGRWNNLAILLSDYFHNLRDINRFITSLTFQMSAVKIKQQLEVNVVDLLGLEIIKVFEPETYKMLFRNKSLLTTSSPSSRQDGNEESKEQLLVILNSSNTLTKKRTQAVLEILFPNISWANNGDLYIVGKNDFLKKRICHIDRFNRYFTFQMEQSDFHQNDFEEVLGITNNHDKLYDKLLDYHKEDRLNFFIGKLQSFVERIPSEDATVFINTIFKLGDVVDNERKEMLVSGTLDRLKYILDSYLKRKEFNKNKMIILKQALIETKSIVLPLSILYYESCRPGDKRDDLYVFNEDEKHNLESLFIKKINEFKNNTDFYENSFLPSLVSYWIRIDSENALNWLNKRLVNAHDLISFLERMISYSFMETGSVSKRIPVIYLFELKRLFSDVQIVFDRFDLYKNNFTTNQDLIDAMKNVKLEYLDPKKHEKRKWGDGFDEDD